MATTPVDLGEGPMTQVLMLEGEGATGEAGKGVPGGTLAPSPGSIFQIMKQAQEGYVTCLRPYSRDINRMRCRSRIWIPTEVPPLFPEATYPLQAVSRDLVKCHLTELALGLRLNRG